MRRFTRLEKYRQKNQTLIITCKVALIGYLFIFSVSYLTASTVAYFSSPEHVSKINITAGTWEDDEAENDLEVQESSLAFMEANEEDTINSCPAEIEVEIKNDGDKMQEEGFFEIYYTLSGDPYIDGEKLELDDDEGVIGILGAEETATLAYEANEPGVYMFVVYDHEDVVMSEEIIVECEIDQNEQTNNNNDHVQDPVTETDNEAEADESELEQPNSDEKEANEQENDESETKPEDTDSEQNEQEESNEVDHSENVEDVKEDEEKKSNEVD